MDDFSETSMTRKVEELATLPGTILSQTPLISNFLNIKAASVQFPKARLSQRRTNRLKVWMGTNSWKTTPALRKKAILVVISLLRFDPQLQSLRIERLQLTHAQVLRVGMQRLQNPTRRSQSYCRSNQRNSRGLQYKQQIRFTRINGSEHSKASKWIKSGNGRKSIKSIFRPLN